MAARIDARFAELKKQGLSAFITFLMAGDPDSFFLLLHGLLRGACHRARIRATRWLAMTQTHLCILAARCARGLLNNLRPER
jgi:hypothetical protein